MGIRKARLNDYEDLAKLNIDLGYDYPVEKVKKNLKNILDKNIDHIYVAVNENDHPIGFIHFGKSTLGGICVPSLTPSSVKSILILKYWRVAINAAEGKYIFSTTKEKVELSVLVIPTVR